MIIEFRVGNYRSIKGLQVLSLVAAKDKSHPDNIIATEVYAIPSVVRSAIVYGANASGKSNLIDALAFMQKVVAQSATTMQLGQRFYLQPFRLDATTATEPSEFEITFLEGGIRYQYGFKLTAEHICEEWLLVYEKPKAQQWFTRHYNPATQQSDYTFGTHLRGQRKLWQDSTRLNALFLSTAVQLNSEQLSPIFNWIVNVLVILVANRPLALNYSTNMLQDQQGKSDLEAFLTSADISISNIELTSQKGHLPNISFDPVTGKPDIRIEEKDILLPQFRHETGYGAATFEFHEESLGTQKLFSLTGPILNILKTGRVLVVDELESSLHPLLVRRLVELFHRPSLNTKGAQLIFSSHDTSLLDPMLFRRDQIWFLEKNHDQETTLYPLTDFSPRKNEAIERGYLAGRYGAIPLFRDWMPKESADGS